ncbi:uncharacterized protein BJ212DRAFT_1479925 [Suillus subaureus]|uniref:Uncharacterized protein n=1 Tax=Suillus subaureus TaxID=48587 RepID=A0A9P7ECZ9_9AGAM|nr:uncharacterized protein BJ212DRAFT_1479925 [Suillus subaureus]KAG1818100.1 hypothetical protein BJ212DRAFT_1479925 [Suillus subaureus]
MPKPFPPILFPNLIEDPSLKTVFGNWELFGKAMWILLWGGNGLTALQAGGPLRNGNRWEVTSLMPGLLAWVGIVVVFLLSADKEFCYSGKGKMMKIQYSYMFTSYKKILVKNWNTEYTHDIVKKLNEEDFTAAMDRALAEDIMDETVADAKANRERLRPNSPLTSEPDEDEVSNIVTAPAAARGH